MLLFSREMYKALARNFMFYFSSSVCPPFDHDLYYTCICFNLMDLFMRCCYCCSIHPIPSCTFDNHFSAKEILVKYEIFLCLRGSKKKTKKKFQHIDNLVKRFSCSLISFDLTTRIDENILSFMSVVMCFDSLLY